MKICKVKIELLTLKIILKFSLYFFRTAYIFFGLLIFPSDSLYFLRTAYILVANQNSYKSKSLYKQIIQRLIYLDLLKYSIYLFLKLLHLSIKYIFIHLTSKLIKENIYFTNKTLKFYIHNHLKSILMMI